MSVEILGNMDNVPPRQRKAMRLSAKHMREDLRLSEEIMEWWRIFKKFQVVMRPEEGARWKVDHFTVIGSETHALRAMVKGMAFVPGLYTRLAWWNGDEDNNGQKVWQPMMSDTPSELYDLKDFWWLLKFTEPKSVLINGLGLGCAVKMALSFKCVQMVHVVEKDREVIGLTGKYYEDKRVLIVNDDALTVKWPTGMRWDIVWSDIWLTICEDNKDEITKLKRRYCNRSDAHGIWAEERIKRERKRREQWRKLNAKV